MEFLLRVIQGAPPTAARAGKKILLDFQKTLDPFITYTLNYQTVEYLDFLLHVDL